MSDHDSGDEPPVDEPPVDDLFSIAGGSRPTPALPDDEPGEVAENPYVIDHSLSSAPIIPQPVEVAPETQIPNAQPAPSPAPFGRRAPVHGPPADQYGYYPSDYYIGPDWMRIVVGGLAAVVVIMGMVAGGLWLWDEFGDNATIDDEVVEATPTPIPLVPVFQCAGDAQPVTEMLAPADLLIAGRTASGRWLAFRNPQAPPRQLWVRSSDLPNFDTTTVGVVRCSTNPDEFPTPVGRSTPVPTIQADPTPTPT